MTTMTSNQVLLEQAVTAIEELVSEDEHGDRGHVSHYLFALRAAGHDIDYGTVMCLTGTAFSFYYCHDNFHVAYSMPDGWERRAANVVGGEWEWLPQAVVEDAWKHVKDSVDSGRIVWGEYMEGVTFAGYAEAERKEDRQVFALDPVFVWPGKWWTWAEFEQWWNEWAKPFPPAMGRYAGTSKTESSESRVEILRLIPTWSQDDHPEDLPEARFGLAGIERYARDIADTSKDEDGRHELPVRFPA